MRIGQAKVSRRFENSPVTRAERRGLRRIVAGAPGRIGTAEVVGVPRGEGRGEAARVREEIGLALAG